MHQLRRLERHQQLALPYVAPHIRPHIGDITVHFWKNADLQECSQRCRKLNQLFDPTGDYRRGLEMRFRGSRVGFFIGCVITRAARGQ